MHQICVFGDSVAKGIVFDDLRHHYSLLKENCMALAQKELQIPIRNFASFGATITKGKKILERKFSQLENCDYTLLEFGGNDCNLNWKEISDSPLSEHDAETPLQTFRKTYEVLIEKTYESGSQPILLTLPPLDSERFFQWVSQGLNKENILHFLGNDINSIEEWHSFYNDMIYSLANQ